jgi:hypothetical protein
MREHPGYRPAVSGSNRGFWKVVVPLVVAGILLVVLVLEFRPVARTGAVAYAQANLRRVAEAAEDLATDGSLADADRETLAARGVVDDLLLIDPDQTSNDPEVVSVLATRGAWTGSARAETGECFWIRVGASGGTVYGRGTDCSADQASAAPPGTWPEP